MSNCRNIHITGLTLADGPCRNVHMVCSDHITTDHCTFCSQGMWNGDGWDPEGNVIKHPTWCIRIFDCMSYFGHGITIGSEMSGGVEDVRIWDCNLANAMFGVEIKGAKKRGGYVHNVHMRDCTVVRVLMHAVGYNDDGIGAPVPPSFSGCTFENIRILGKCLNHENIASEYPAIELEGFDMSGYEVEDITFRDCTVARNAEVKMHRCKHISIQLDQID